MEGVDEGIKPISRLPYGLKSCNKWVKIPHKMVNFHPSTRAEGISFISDVAFISNTVIFGIIEDSPNQTPLNLAA